MARRIVIAGGGIAGLTLGILLRRTGVPVEIWDAAGYPRHRVCGEFISGHGADLLNGLDLFQKGPWQVHRGRTVQIFADGRAGAPMTLPRPALCIPRSELDELLAQEFIRSGGELLERKRWTDSFAKEGVVRASGRRLAGSGDPGIWMGLKVHAANLPLGSDLELHFSSQGYAGISRLSGGRVNICALVRPAAAGKNLRTEYPALLASLLSGRTREAFERAELDERSFSAITGLSLRVERATAGMNAGKLGKFEEPGECRVGDSICMIPPLTGNGMSLAIESAWIAAPALADYAQGRAEWVQTRRRISRECDRKFRWRLRSASVLQKITERKALRATMMSILETAPGLFNLFYFATR